MKVGNGNLKASLLAAVLGTLAMPAIAHASVDVNRTGTTLTIDANNNATVTVGYAASTGGGDPPDFVIGDGGGVDPNGANCVTLTATVARCTDPGGAVASVVLNSLTAAGNHLDGTIDDAGADQVPADVVVTLNGGPGVEDFDSGDGADALHGNGGANTLDGGDGDDDIDSANTDPSISPALNGGPGDDQLTGGPGTDTLNGGPGDDLILGNASIAPDEDDVFNGGTNGTPGGQNGANGDTVSYAGRLSDVDVDIDGAADDGTGCVVSGAGCEGDLVGSDVENLTGGDGVDFMFGDANANRLDGGPRSDTLFGGQSPGADGNDTFIGGADGTRGDTVDYSDRADRLEAVIGATGGTFPAGTGDTDQIGADIENLTGGADADQLGGDADANTINGGPGADYMTGSIAAGSDGADTFIGGSNSVSNPLRPPSIGDIVTYEFRADDIFADVGAGATDGAGGCPASAGCEDDEIQSDVETLIGGDGDDVLTGDDEANFLAGLDGDDELHGGQGSGADGADIFSGGINGEAGDTTSYDGRTASVHADLSAGGAVSGSGGCPGPGCEGDTFFLGDTENVVGGMGADVLRGNNNPNRLVGGLGADTLTGFAAADRIEARDGIGDNIDCGADGDVAVVDSPPLDQPAIGCETLDAPPVIPPVVSAPVPNAVPPVQAAKKCKKGQKLKKGKCVKKRKK